MKCRKCHFQWNIGNITPVTAACPVCGCDYEKQPEKRAYTSITEAVQVIFMEQYAMIKNNPKLLHGMLNDYFPALEEERQTARQVIDEKFFGSYEAWKQAEAPETEVREYLFQCGIEDGAVLSKILFLIGYQKEPGDDLNNPELYMAFSDQAGDQNIQKMYFDKALSLTQDMEKIKNITEKRLQADAVGTVEMIINLAERGDMDSMKKLLNFYDKGIYVKKDWEKAEQYADRLLSSGDKDGYFYKSKYILLCHRTAENLSLAEEFLQKAEEQGDGRAAYYSYLLHYNGFASLQADIKKAMSSLEAACNAGNMEAVYDYSLHLFYGDCIEQDVDAALRYLTMAANHGNEAAIRKLAYLYKVGDKVQKDKEKAVQYEKLLEVK